ncbi:MAG: hypothetical protein ACAH89_12445 [Rariglobus sp.]|nr:hypothetical protein [Rariglobus sp.]
MSEETPKKHPNLYKRVTASVPLLVTVIVHVVLIGIAGYFVVSEQIIGKKKIMEASAATESVAQKQVEHRLQVARKGGGSASSSPVSASRIFSTAENALQVPAMPDLPSVGASSLSGMGFGAGLGGVGGGTGYNTGIGNGNGLGSGFMSMSFLGTTSQRASKVVFVIDVGTSLMDIRKGGFEAFQIIRDEMAKLVSRLPPSAEFGVVVFESGTSGADGWVTSFDRTLLPATVANKERLFAWIKPINTDSAKVGIQSVPNRVTWRPKPLPNAGLDDTLTVPLWTRALRAALELEPDTVYLITGSAGSQRRKVSEAVLAKRKRENEEYLADLKREGLDLNAVAAARNAALNKARSQLDAVNAKLKAAGKSPFIIQDTKRIFDGDFQAALKRIGETIKLDTAGWTTKDGRLLWWTGYSDWEGAEYADVITHISQLQRALLKDRAALNIFLFVGPNEEPKASMENLGKTSTRNGGKFELITTKRLQELAKRDEEKK